MEICKVYIGILNSTIFIGGVIVGFISAVIFVGSSENYKKTGVNDNCDLNEVNEIDHIDSLKDQLAVAEDSDIELVVINNQTQPFQSDISRTEDNSTLNYLDEPSMLISPVFNTNANSALSNPLYFSIPSDQNGRFDLNNKKEAFDTKCHYCINITSPNRGELSYLSSDKDFRAIEGYSNYLLPVCEVENFADKSKARNIQMLEKGQVYLENGSWVVDKNKKVKIRFI
jgi:hypothetical protein